MGKNEVVPIILFTGAGASCAKGIELPNMTQFFNLIMDKNHYPTDNLIKQKQYFKYVMDCLYPDSDEQTVYDLEKVLGTLYKLGGVFIDDAALSILNEKTLFERMANAAASECTRQTGKGISSLNLLTNAIETAHKQRYQEIKQSAVELLHELQMVIRKTYSSVSFSGIYEVYGTLFKKLFSLIEKVQKENDDKLIFPIFTTNYDPSIDYVLRPSLSPECRALHDEWRKKVSKYIFIDGFIPHEYAPSFVWRREAFSQENDEGLVIHYHKLHGSALWEKRDGEIVFTTDAVSDLSEMPRSFNMIYPSDKTTPDEDPYAFSHYELERYLKKAKVLVVIGFAFRDPGIVNLFQRGLIENKDLSIIVLGPAAKEWEPEYQKFLNLERVSHLERYFGEVAVTDELIKMLEEKLIGSAIEI